MNWVQAGVGMKMGQVDLRLSEPGARTVLMADEATKVSGTEVSHDLTSSNARHGRFCAPPGQVEIRAFCLRKLYSAYAQQGAQKVEVRSRKIRLLEKSGSAPARISESARMSVAVPTENHVLGYAWPRHSAKASRG